MIGVKGAAMLLILALLAAPAAAQDNARERADRIFIPAGQAMLKIDRADKIPRKLRAAMDAGCNYRKWLADYPLRIFRPDRNDTRMIALAPCGHSVLDGAAFLVSRWGDAQPIGFVVVSYPQGFTSAAIPGYLEWDEDSRTLTATRGTDVCPDREVRHIYRYRPGDFPFTLHRVEYRPKTCGLEEGPWRLFWEAPDWKEPN